MGGYFEKNPMTNKIKKFLYTLEHLIPDAHEEIPTFALYHPLLYLCFYNFTLSTSVTVAESSSSKECGGSSLEPVSECEEDEGLSMRRNLAP